MVLARKQRGEAALRDVNFCLLKDPDGGMTLYAAACVSALLARGNEEMARQALDLLRRAFERGYGREKAGDDDDLAGLRARPDFRDLTGGK